MPPVTQQNRAGLITAVVILTILVVTATIFAIYFNAEFRRVEAESQDFRKRFTDVVAEGQLNSEAVQNLKALRANPPYSPSMKVLDVVFAQRDALVKLLAGKESFADAEAAARQKLTDVVSRAKLTGTPDNMVAALDALAATVQSAQTTADQNAQQLKTAQAERDAAQKQIQQQIAAVNKDLEAIRAQSQQALQATASDRAAVQAQVAAIEKQMEGERKAAIEGLQKKDADLAARQRELVKVQKDLDQVRTRLTATRIDPKEPAIRHADGQIVRIPSRDVVYINRGQGDQIVPGMTFEVYDKIIGIPPLGEGLSNENLPVGKASIEVLRVEQNSSECRIIKLQPGMTLTEGDLIVNLVYDPNTKYNFFVYGKFDLDQNGVATAQDTEVIKRLVGQWGAKIADAVSVNTDFVVLGVEPVVPNYTQEELQDPAIAKRRADIQAELDAYLEVVQKARELHVPILNQNRFLYFVGYYDLAKR